MANIVPTAQDLRVPERHGYSMSKVNTSDLVPGMVLESDVYNYNDQLILPEGLRLNDKAITKLTFYSISSVRIKEDSVVNTPLPDFFESSFSQRLKRSPEYMEFQKNFEQNVKQFSMSISDVVEKNAPLNVDIMVNDALALLHPENGDISVFDMIHNMRQYDDLTFAHSVNVGLICNVFAGWLGMSADDQKLALTCGLLHDIGKLKIPENIIKKPAKLTDSEYDIIKTHPIEGYKILQRYPINEHIRNAALMHHEKCDGSGYPLGFTGDKIDKFAKIVAIADVYEATTAARIYRGPLCPFQVISIFENEGLLKYDTQMIMTFLENIINTYIQNRVRLSNGMEGDIIFINKQSLSKPTIKCGTEYIDLIQYPDLYIDAII